MERKMLYKMCHEMLNKTDMKAIRKARGFPIEANDSKSLLESVFLSHVGVAAAMSKLTTEEVALLHLLNLIDNTVNIEFFARIYGDSKTRAKSYLYTFTQRYSDVFKKVQRSLVRKGILLAAEVGNGDTKLERMRFRLPNEFKAFLPPLFPAAKDRALDGLGDSNQTVLREKIMTSLNKIKVTQKSNEAYKVRVSSGNLYFGDRRFSLKKLQEWQHYKWKPAIPSISSPSHNIKNIEPIQFVSYAFGELKANEWMLADELTLFLDIFYYNESVPKATEICKKGWQCGCLAKQKTNGNVYYRLAPPLSSKESQVLPDIYLSVTSQGTVKIDLQAIPYEALEYLTRISDLKVQNGTLTASANLNKFGDAPDHLRRHELSLWLRDNAEEFKQMMALVDERWGKQILHDNLFVARVRDLTLKVRLQQAFPDPKQLITLSNEFVAFPRGLLSEVEKVVKKTGNVIKTVK